MSWWDPRRFRICRDYPHTISFVSACLCAVVTALHALAGNGLFALLWVGIALLAFATAPKLSEVKAEWV